MAGVWGTSGSSRMGLSGGVQGAPRVRITVYRGSPMNTRTIAVLALIVAVVVLLIILL